VKWVFLFGILLLAPCLTALFRAKPSYIVPGCFLLGASIFILAPGFWTAIEAWPAWPGYAKGLEITIVDPVSIALILSTKPVRIPWSIKIPFGLLCLGLIVSTFAASQVMPSFFYIWELFRTVLMFLAIARVAANVKGAPVALIAGLGVGFIYEAGLALSQYASGTARPGGNLGHSNFLGMASHFVVFPAVALLLGTRRFFWPSVVVFAGLIASVVGESRATMGLLFAGVLLTVLFSLVHKSTSRKTAFGGAAALIMLIALPVMTWSASQRPQEALESSDLQREAMKRAAAMILADHPFGVGADQYVIVANVGGYSQRAGVAWNEDTRAAPVHNTYYLVAAEFGFIGLLGFLATLASFIMLGFRLVRRKLPDEMIELVPGLLVAVLAVSVHMYFEWIFMTFLPHYLFAIAGGLMVAIAARTRAGAAAKESPSRNVLKPIGAWTGESAAVQ
jgi:hypothetical protein